MFPAPAGMSPPFIYSSSSFLDVPRTRGDEPAATNFAPAGTECSPHPRG